MSGNWQTEAYRRLNQPVENVAGPHKGFAKLKIKTLGDLLGHLPRRYFGGADELTDLAELQPGEDVAVKSRVSSSQTFGYGKRMRLVVTLTDQEQHELDLTFFGAEHMINYWQSALSDGALGIFAGKIGAFRNRLQLNHPDFVIIDERGNPIGGPKRSQRLAKVSQVPGLFSVYPSTSSFDMFQLTEIVDLGLHEINSLADPLTDWIREEADLIDLESAYRAVHHPLDRQQSLAGRRRLQFDEALAVQLTMAYRRAQNSHLKAVVRTGKTGGLLDQFDQRSPFTLTAGQSAVSAEIFADLAQDHPMQRLLQGDVGSGKTLVSLRAMLRTVDSGGQAVLLAPTETLAQQHYRTITNQLGELSQAGQLLGSADATGVVLLTGSMSAVQKQNTLLKIASGEAGIVIGTHALLGPQIQFADLGLVIIDEQHRFGVEQRANLTDRGETRPHVLVMTATPIPRSIAMTLFGDLEVSQMRDSPANRPEISSVVVDTAAHPDWVDRAWQRAKEEVAKGNQVFIIAPRIGGDSKRKSESTTGTSAVDLYQKLSTTVFADQRVGLLHGALPNDQKERVMSEFADGNLDILVSTTVVEVGIDVPNATMMIIVDAEQFGISQLHQLRGRVGRGTEPSLCLLMSSAEPDAKSWQRLGAVAQTTDGFALAEHDLAQRREGDVLGASQAGSASSFRLIRVVDHVDEINLSREIAAEMVLRDPELTTDLNRDLVASIESLVEPVWMERN